MKSGSAKSWKNILVFVLFFLVVGAAGVAAQGQQPLPAARNFEVQKLAEGVYSAAIAARLAREHGIEAPIIEAVAAILEDGLPAAGAMRALLARPLKREFE